jgi:F0F1-type ATP synthase membrane subunit b/b'
MTENLILVVVIANALITPILTYLINSRCTRITTPCCQIERDVLEAKDLQKQKEKEEETDV